MAKVIAIHTISRMLDDQQTAQELPPGTVFECSGQELDDFRKAGAVADADSDETLTDLSGMVRTDAALALPATSTLIPGVVPGAEVVVEPKPKKAKA